MKIVNNMLSLTWKEDLYCGPAMLVKDADWPHSEKYGVLKKIPKWKQVLAPLQHWFACTFLGHTPFDPSSFSNFQEYTVPGTGCPKYDITEGAWAPNGPIVLVDRLGVQS